MEYELADDPAEAAHVEGVDWDDLLPALDADSFLRDVNLQELMSLHAELVNDPSHPELDQQQLQQLQQQQEEGGLLGQQQLGSQDVGLVSLPGSPLDALLPDAGGPDWEAIGQGLRSHVLTPVTEQVDAAGGGVVGAPQPFLPAPATFMPHPAAAATAPAPGAAASTPNLHSLIQLSSYSRVLEGGEGEEEVPEAPPPAAATQLQAAFDTSAVQQQLQGAWGGVVGAPSTKAVAMAPAKAGPAGGLVVPWVGVTAQAASAPAAAGRPAPWGAGTQQWGGAASSYHTAYAAAAPQGLVGWGSAAGLPPVAAAATGGGGLAQYSYMGLQDLMAAAGPSADHSLLTTSGNQTSGLDCATTPLPAAAAAAQTRGKGRPGCAGGRGGFPRETCRSCGLRGVFGNKTRLCNDCIHYRHLMDAPRGQGQRGAVATLDLNARLPGYYFANQRKVVPHTGTTLTEEVLSTLDDWTAHTPELLLNFLVSKLLEFRAMLVSKGRSPPGAAVVPEAHRQVLQHLLLAAVAESAPESLPAFKDYFAAAAAQHQEQQQQQVVVPAAGLPVGKEPEAAVAAAGGAAVGGPHLPWAAPWLPKPGTHPSAPSSTAQAAQLAAVPGAAALPGPKRFRVTTEGPVVTRLVPPGDSSSERPASATTPVLAAPVRHQQQQQMPRQSATGSNDDITAAPDQQTAVRGIGLGLISPGATSRVTAPGDAASPAPLPPMLLGGCGLGLTPMGSQPQPQPADYTYPQQQPRPAAVAPGSSPELELALQQFQQRKRLREVMEQHPQVQVAVQQLNFKLWQMTADAVPPMVAPALGALAGRCQGVGVNMEPGCVRVSTLMLLELRDAFELKQQGMRHLLQLLLQGPSAHPYWSSSSWCVQWGQQLAITKAGKPWQLLDCSEEAAADGKLPVVTRVTLAAAVSSGKSSSSHSLHVQVEGPHLGTSDVKFAVKCESRTLYRGKGELVAAASLQEVDGDITPQDSDQNLDQDQDLEEVVLLEVALEPGASPPLLLWVEATAGLYAAPARPLLVVEDAAVAQEICQLERLGLAPDYQAGVLVNMALVLQAAAGLPLSSMGARVTPEQLAAKAQGLCELAAAAGWQHLAAAVAPVAAAVAAMPVAAAAPNSSTSSAAAPPPPAPAAEGELADEDVGCDVWGQAPREVAADWGNNLSGQRPPLATSPLGGAAGLSSTGLPPVPPAATGVGQPARVRLEEVHSAMATGGLRSTTGLRSHQQAQAHKQQQVQVDATATSGAAAAAASSCDPCLMLPCLSAPPPFGCNGRQEHDRKEQQQQQEREGMAGGAGAGPADGSRTRLEAVHSAMAAGGRGLKGQQQHAQKAAEQQAAPLPFAGTYFTPAVEEEEVVREAGSPEAGRLLRCLDSARCVEGSAKGAWVLDHAATMQELEQLNLENDPRSTASCDF